MNSQRVPSFAKPALSLLTAAALLPLLASLLAPPLSAQPFDQRLFGEMRWRSIGPYRGGRTRAVAGVPSQPNVFYIGVCNGGVWKTTDYGRTWKPDLRRPADRLDRRHRRRALRPEHHLCRERRRPAAARPLRRRRHLQIDRRRQDLDAPRPARRPADPADHRRSAQPGPPLRRRRSAIPTARTRSAASSARPTAARPSRRSSTRTKTPAAPSSPSTRRIPTSSTPASGNRGRAPGKTPPGAAPAAASSSRPTAARPGGSSIAAPRRTQSSRSTSPSRPSDPRRIYAAIATLPRHGHLPLGRRRRDLGAARPTRARPRRIGGGDLPRLGRPSRRTRTSSSSPAPSPGNRPTAARPGPAFKGAPGGDDYQNIWINPTNPDIILFASDQGAIVTVNGGQTWSSWYNQPTRPALSRRGRQRLSLPRLQRPAGERLGRRREPRQRRPDHLPRVAPGRRRRVRLRRARPARPGHRLRRPERDPLRPAHRPGAERRPEAGPRRRTVRTVRTQPVLFSPVDPHILYLRRRTRSGRRANGGQSWEQISPDLTRKTWEVPASVGKYKDGNLGEAGPARRHLHRRPVVRRRQPHLGRHRRRPDPRDDGRRPALERRDAAAAHAVGQGLDHRRRPLRRPDRLRGHQHPPPRRHAAAHLPDARRRQDLDAHHQRHSRRRAGQRRPRGPEAQGPAVRRHRARGLRLVRRRRPLAVAAAEHAGDARCATSSSRTTTWSSATHGRGFWILDDITPLRQLDANAAAAEAVLFKPQAAYARPVEHEHRHAAAARRAGRARIRRTARSSITR